MTSHDETLLLELLGNITGRGARHFDPSLGEGGAGEQHVRHEDGRVNRIKEGFLDGQWRGPSISLVSTPPCSSYDAHVVNKTRGGLHLSGAVLGLPGTDELDKEIVAESREQHLADEEDVGRQSRLQHDRHVGGVEQANGVRPAHTTLARRLEGNFDAEALKVNDGAEDSDGGQKVQDVRAALAIESLAKSELLVRPSDEQVNERDDGTLEFGTTTGVNGAWGESLPYDVFADVGRDKERDTTSQSIALLEELVEQDDDQSSGEELNDKQDTDTGTEIGRLAVEAGQYVGASLAKGQDDGEELGLSVACCTNGPPRDTFCAVW